MIKFIALAFVIFLVVADALARDQKAVKAYRADHVCPATGKTTGACPGWVVDHIKPLCAGGVDAPANMQWQPYMQSKEKDKIEIAFCRCMAKQLAPCILPPNP